MTTDIRSEDGWTLRGMTEADIDELMSWFVSAGDVNIWGGPSFRYPFTRETFIEDIHWGRMASFSLHSPAGDLAAFGQLYERFACMNLARLVVNPSIRGKGVGKRLITLLMRKGPSLFSSDKFSLFVFRENLPAYECYKSMGFVVTKYPDEMPHGDACYYLTRPAQHLPGE
jgi:ribosomal protein S18 acetylase RimI-like enzyme